MASIAVDRETQCRKTLERAFRHYPTTKTTTPPIWIHAASVGETLAVTPLIKQIKQRSPNTPILLTTTTPTGAEQAEKLADWVEHRYTPIDFSFAVRGFLRRVRPCQLIIVETELWPNTLHTVAKAGLPITLVNATFGKILSRLSAYSPVL